MQKVAVFILLSTFVWSTPVMSQMGAPSLVEIKAAAEAGDPVAQVKMAERDPNHADQWYRKAAEQGYTPAQGRLGSSLLLRYRMTIVKKEPSYTEMGDEALKWITLAANQGDRRGQADLAGLCLEGKLVKQDLIEAYKWGDIAGSGPLTESFTYSGRSTRDAATLKMTSDQIAEAQKRVAAFTPHKPNNDDMPEPAWVKQIKLSGLSGPEGNRLAIINGKTFSPGESNSIKINGKIVNVHCLEIREKSVLVEIEGIDKSRELPLSGVDQ